MPLQHYKGFFLYLFLILVFVSCKRTPKATLYTTVSVTIVQPKKISISDLAKNYKLYQGKYIETTGIFYQALEEFAIYPPKTLFGNRKGFWLKNDLHLTYDSLFFAKANGCDVKIKGVVDTTSRGHLGQYLATISGIYFWERY